MQIFYTYIHIRMGFRGKNIVLCISFVEYAEHIICRTWNNKRTHVFLSSGFRDLVKFNLICFESMENLAKIDFYRCYRNMDVKREIADVFTLMLGLLR